MNNTISVNNWYTTEIQQMLHGFGDSPNPLLETATLVESILYQQMQCILHFASEVAEARTQSIIDVECLVFLMRKKPVKLKRFLKYLSIRDWKSNKKLEMGDPLNLASLASTTTSKVKLCLNFLKEIDPSGQLADLVNPNNPDQPYDSVRKQREIRAAELSQALHPLKYLDYVKARQMSFGSKNALPKFQEWICRALPPALTLTPTAVDVLAYLAYETIAELVDLALLVRHSTLTRPLDPAYQNPSCAVINPDFPMYSTAQQNTKTTASLHPIQPSEIQEAYRRFQNPSQIWESQRTRILAL